MPEREIPVTRPEAEEAPQMSDEQIKRFITGAEKLGGLKGLTDPDQFFNEHPMEEELKKLGIDLKEATKQAQDWADTHHEELQQLVLASRKGGRASLYGDQEK